MAVDLWVLKLLVDGVGDFGGEMLDSLIDGSGDPRGQLLQSVLDVVLQVIELVQGLGDDDGQSGRSQRKRWYQSHLE